MRKEIAKKIVKYLGLVLIIGIVICSGSPNPNDGEDDKEDLPHIATMEVEVKEC